MGLRIRQLGSYDLKQKVQINLLILLSILHDLCTKSGQIASKVEKMSIVVLFTHVRVRFVFFFCWEIVH